MCPPNGYLNRSWPYNRRDVVDEAMESEDSETDEEEITEVIEGEIDPGVIVNVQGIVNEDNLPNIQEYIEERLDNGDILGDVQRLLDRPDYFQAAMIAMEEDNDEEADFGNVHEVFLTTAQLQTRIEESILEEAILEQSNVPARLTGRPGMTMERGGIQDIAQKQLIPTIMCIVQRT